MRARVCKNISGWNDPGWVLLPIGVSAVFAANYLRPLFALIPPCVFHALTGLPCPACGSTRAGLALAAGEVFTAFRLQPLFVLACFGAAVFGLRSLAAIATGKRMIFEFAPRERVIIRYVLIALILLNWLYLVVVGR